MAEAASSTNNFAIIVTDNIAPSIAPNLQKISAQATAADKSIRSLRDALALMSGSNLSSIKVELDSGSIATSRLKASTEGLGSAAVTAYNKMARGAREVAVANKEVAASVEAVQALTTLKGEQLSLFSAITPTSNNGTLDLFATQLTASSQAATELSVANKEAAATTQQLTTAANEANAADEARAASLARIREFQARIRAERQAELAQQQQSAAATQADNAATQASAGIKNEAASATNSLAAAQAEVSTATAAATSATTVNNAAMKELAETSIKLSIARKQLNAEMKALAEIQGLNLAPSAQSKEMLAEAEARVLAAQQEVLALRALRAEQARTVSSMTSVGKAAHSMITPVQAASGTIRVLEGNFGTNVRAAENFMVKILGMGPILQAAFPIIGAMAMVGVIDILTDHVGSLVEAFKRLAGAEIEAEIAATKAGNKILKIKPEGFMTSENFAKLLIGDFTANKPIEIESAQAKLKQIQNLKELNDLEAEGNEKGLQGLQLLKAKEQTLKNQKEYARQAKEQVDILATQYEKLLTAEHTVSRKSPLGTETDIGKGLAANLGVEPPAAVKVKNVSNEAQIKAIKAEFDKAVDASKAFQHEMDMTQIRIENLRKGEGLASMKDGIKAAREQMDLFNRQMADLKTSADKVVTPQERLALLDKQKAIALPQNQTEIEQRRATEIQAIERQKQTLDMLAERYQDQADNIGLYSDALREKQMIDKLDQQLMRDGIDLNSKKVQSIRDNIRYVAQNANYERQLKGIYQDTVGPMRNYEAAQRAIADLEKDKAISHDQAVAALNMARNAYEDATQPLNAYLRGLQQEIDLLGKVGTEYRVAAQVQQVQNELRQKGRSLSQSEQTQLSQYLTQLERQRNIQQELNNLYEESIGLAERLADRYAAILQLKNNDQISTQRLTAETAKLNVANAELNLEWGKQATVSDLLTATFGNYIREFQGFNRETTKLYQEMFSTIADGAADSLGRALVYAEDLGEGLKDVARQALAQLISGMIKLGIQMLITSVLGRTLGQSAVVSTTAQAASVAAAWAPAAAFASLATLGANAAPAMGALLSTTALSEALAALSSLGAVGGRMATGGYISGPGTGTSDDILLRASNGEFIVNARATAQHRALLEAINRGSSVQGPSSVGTAGAAPKVDIKIIHDGSTGVEVQQISETEIRVIARQEAKTAVEQHSPRVVAADLRNPNSQTSKAIVRTKETRERR